MITEHGIATPLRPKLQHDSVAVPKRKYQIVEAALNERAHGRVYVGTLEWY